MRHWIKLYTEIVNDPKMGRLSNREFRTCINLFCLAGIIDEDGSLPDPEDIAWQLRICLDDLKADLGALAAVGILEQTPDGWRVRKWDDRQAKAPSDQPAEVLKRVTKHRNSKRNETVTPLQSEGNEKVTQLEKNRSDQNREETEEIRKEEIPPSPPFESASAGRALAGKLTTLNGQVPAISRVPLVEKLLDIYGLRALVDAGDDAALYALHEQAVKLYRMGYHSPESIDALAGLWKEKDWRGQKGDRPRNGQFIEFASQNAPNAKTVRKTPKQITVIDPITGEHYEVTA